jgi:fatty acid desaturase
MEELRGHSPKPDEQERAWMSANPFMMLVRVVALAGIAVAIGTSVSYLSAPKAPTVAAAHQ